MSWESIGIILFLVGAALWNWTLWARSGRGEEAYYRLFRDEIRELGAPSPPPKESVETVVYRIMKHRIPHWMWGEGTIDPVLAARTPEVCCNNCKNFTPHVTDSLTQDEIEQAGFGSCAIRGVRRGDSACSSFKHSDPQKKYGVYDPLGE